MLEKQSAVSCTVTLNIAQPGIFLEGEGTGLVERRGRKRRETETEEWRERERIPSCSIQFHRSPVY